ncbi:MAG: hypothetical protein AUJ88_06820 [Gallionellaceae bacterium CG1_02_56_997]|nr:MAG: hypothetical protein AUJ88_06820 [Gallionellaceae bacterium CG1_02_56_997]PIX04181.1 MAG: hypothetical protein COZ77_07850 [Gallionellales bacterium CG_4_8_14_3_um_filter_54_18]
MAMNVPDRQVEGLFLIKHFGGGQTWGEVQYQRLRLEAGAGVLFALCLKSGCVFAAARKVSAIIFHL